MSAMYLQPLFTVDADERRLAGKFRIVNTTSAPWRSSEGFVIGWQMFDPDTGTFIEEGEWLPLGDDLGPGESRDLEISVQLPRERGRYHVYISPLQEERGWFYQEGHSFILIDAQVEQAKAELSDVKTTTLRRMRWRKRAGSLPKFFAAPIRTIWTHAALIRSLVRRDILTRYRGSAGDVLWTVLHPLLLMATYFFVFGIVLQSRLGSDTSRTSFALYFLAGMLCWLAISESIGRAPSVVLEHRNFVKKLIFPVEILPMVQVLSGVVTQTFATGLFLIALFVIKGWIPAAIVWLPVLLIPQILFTAGLAWSLAALGVFLRDLSQIIGFLLTLWFFITPICYPETLLPAGGAEILTKNPVYVLVREYRTILLDGSAPQLNATVKLWVVGVVVFLFGHALFYKLRKSFVDVI